ncbi:MAG: hypothetical protein AAGA78_06125 [Pseudomonadota bacterium]
MSYFGLSFERGQVSPVAGRPLKQSLDEALASVPPSAPVTVLIHGFKFQPGIVGRDPHQLLFARKPACAHWKIISWPRALGFDGDPRTGLAIGFGWEASPEGPTPVHRFRAACRAAEDAGHGLADLLDLIARLAPQRRPQIFAHSLGAAVALRGLAHASPSTTGPSLLLGAAAFAREAQDCLTARPQTAPILNVTSRKNAPYDHLFSAFAPTTHLKRRTLAQGLGAAHPAWVDLALEAPCLPERLAAHGHHLAPSGPGICHWSFYRRGGVMAFYADLLRRPKYWTPARQRALTDTAPAAHTHPGARWGLTGA